uniref:Uncharacterized protein n=1 Tax=Amphimedon queenslandica TaxID=400682 RepID=A0A1X7UVH9_AMPQE
MCTRGKLQKIQLHRDHVSFFLGHYFLILGGAHSHWLEVYLLPLKRLSKSFVTYSLLMVLVIYWSLIMDLQLRVKHLRNSCFSIVFAIHYQLLTIQDLMAKQREQCRQLKMLL